MLNIRPITNRYRVIIPIGGVHQGMLAALDFAQTLSRDLFVIVMPQFVSHKRRAWALHNQTAFLLRMSLILRPVIVIVEVPYQVE